jgi:hypothetical protein
MHGSCGSLSPAECVMWLVAHIGARGVSYVNPNEGGTAVDDIFVRNLVDSARSLVHT